MGFTVYRPDGTKDLEFEAYVRLLRNRGVDIGNVPRVLDPATGNKWLYVWGSAQEAESFRRELTERTRSDAWKVIEVQAPPSQGALGPALFVLSRYAGGFHIAVHPLTRAMIRSAFPSAVPSASNISIDSNTWNEFRTTHGNLGELVREIGPTLTGLSSDQLDRLGIQVVDTDNNSIVEEIPPHVDQEVSAE